MATSVALKAILRDTIRYRDRHVLVRILNNYVRSCGTYMIELDRTQLERLIALSSHSMLDPRMRDLIRKLAYVYGVSHGR